MNNVGEKFWAGLGCFIIFNALLIIAYICRFIYLFFYIPEELGLATFDRNLLAGILFGVVPVSLSIIVILRFLLIEKEASFPYNGRKFWVDEKKWLKATGNYLSSRLSMPNASILNIIWALITLIYGLIAAAILLPVFAVIMLVNTLTHLDKRDPFKKEKNPNTGNKTVNERKKNSSREETRHSSPDLQSYCIHCKKIFNETGKSCPLCGEKLYFNTLRGKTIETSVGIYSRNKKALNNCLKTALLATNTEIRFYDNESPWLLKNPYDFKEEEMVFSIKKGFFCRRRYFRIIFSEKLRETYVDKIIAFVDATSNISALTEEFSDTLATICEYIANAINGIRVECDLIISNTENLQQIPAFKVCYDKKINDGFSEGKAVHYAFETLIEKIGLKEKLEGIDSMNPNLKISFHKSESGKLPVSPITKIIRKESKYE